MSRIVALDVGDVRIGIAVSDPTRTIAQPVETYTRVGWGPDCRYIGELCRRYETDELLLGLPLNMDGTRGFQAEKVLAFGQKLEEAGLRLQYQDERMTTVTAEDVLVQGNVRREDRKKYVDKLAATVILEQWLAEQSRQKGNTMDQNNNIPEIPEDGYQFVDEEEIVTLQDEEGNDVDFYHRMTLVINGTYYIVMEPVDSCDDAMEGECMVMKILQDEDGEDYYATLDDEEEEALVEERLNEILEEEEAQYGEYGDEDAPAEGAGN